MWKVLIVMVISIKYWVGQKVHSSFYIASYEKAQGNFLTNPVRNTMLVIIMNILIKYTFFFGLIITTLIEFLHSIFDQLQKSPTLQPGSCIPCRKPFASYGFFVNSDTSEFWLPYLLPRDTGEVIYLQWIADLSNTDSINLWSIKILMKT